MDVYISFDGDHIGSQVGRLALQNDEEGLRRMSQSIELGNELWEKWCQAKGGSAISTGGDEGRIKVPAEYLEEIPEIRKRYHTLVGATVSVGIGMSLADSNRALIAAKLRGGNQLVVYEPELEEEISRAQKHQTEAEKLSEQYLNKMQRPMSAAKPQTEASEHSQGESMANFYADENPPAPEMTHASEGLHDLENEFHSLAEQEQENRSKPDSTGHEQLKTKIADILQKIKKQAPIMEQIKQASPETYSSMMGMVQAVIQMARALSAKEQQKLGQHQESVAKADSAQNQIPNFSGEDFHPHDGEIWVEEHNQDMAKNELSLAEPHGKATPDSSKTEAHPKEIIAYHGTDKQFDKFQTQTKPGIEKQPTPQPLFFAEDPGFAKLHAKGPGGRIIKAKLKPQKMFNHENLVEEYPSHKNGYEYKLTPTGSKVWNAIESKQIWEDGPENTEDYFKALDRGQWDTHESLPFKGWLKNNGYDSMVVREGNAKNYAVLNPEIIHILDHNHNPDIVKREDVLHGGAADEKEYGEFDPEQLKDGIKHEMEHTKDAKIAAEIAMDHLTEDPDYYKKLKAIEKTSPNPTGRHHTILPPGSTLHTGKHATKNAGRVKVVHGNGKTSWVSVRSGQVMSQDGHPISSRNPKGK